MESRPEKAEKKKDNGKAAKKLSGQQQEAEGKLRVAKEEGRVILLPGVSFIEDQALAIRVAE